MVSNAIGGGIDQAPPRRYPSSFSGVGPIFTGHDSASQKQSSTGSISPWNW